MLTTYSVLGTNLGGNSTLLMLLYLSWSIDLKKNSHLGNNTVLHHVHTTFVNLVELIKDHKLQIDSESHAVRSTPKLRLFQFLAADFQTIAPEDSQVFPRGIFRS